MTSRPCEASVESNMSRRMPAAAHHPVALSTSVARRIWLHAQRLDAWEPFGNGPGATRAGRGVPEPRRLVVGCGDDARAVAAERRARHPFVMACERLADRLTGLGVPDARRLVLRSGDDALAVGAERRAQHLTAVASEHANLFPCRGVPDARGIIIIPRRGDDAPAV